MIQSLFQNPIKNLLKKTVNWFYPPKCLSCNCFVSDPGTLCAACWRESLFLRGPFLCQHCGALKPYREPIEVHSLQYPLEESCDDCPKKKVAFGAARAAMAYTGAGRNLVLALKHRDQTALAATMGLWMAEAGQILLEGYPAGEKPIVMPVPLHWSRRLKRRGDQAAALAHAVAKHWQAPVIEGALYRKRATPPQAALNREERWRNVAAAFGFHRHWQSRLSGRYVILVDDVMTSGATLDICAQLLKQQAKVGQVDVLVFARPCLAAQKISYNSALPLKISPEKMV